MKRALYDKLLNWKNSKNRKPLILRGARQVGKTHLLKQFAEKAYETYVYLNFEEEPSIIDFFNHNLKPEVLLEKIQIYSGKNISHNTLIIFDEIQECPAALNSLKYFQEEAPSYHIVAAGSLLGVKLHNKGFPVGKINFLDLYPLTFIEFLQAIGKQSFADYLMNINKILKIEEPIHNELISLLKYYFYIGGMPEAVQEYINTGTLLSIRNIQNEILRSYDLDFAKHAPKEQIMKITTVWKSIPSQLAKENKKFIFSAIRKSARGREYEDAIQWLYNAGLIYKSYRISTPKLPLSGYMDSQCFKIFMFDVGLLSAMSNIPARLVLENTSLFNEFYGAFTENWAAQALSSQEIGLYYWTSSSEAEVDFIIEHDLNLYPLEVKAGISNKKKSLRSYESKYEPSISLRSTLMNLMRNGNILNIPLYLMNRLMALCKPLEDNLQDFKNEIKTKFSKFNKEELKSCVIPEAFRDIFNKYLSSSNSWTYSEDAEQSCGLLLPPTLHLKLNDNTNRKVETAGKFIEFTFYKDKIQVKLVIRELKNQYTKRDEKGELIIQLKNLQENPQDELSKLVSPFLRLYGYSDSSSVV